MLTRYIPMDNRFFLLHTFVRCSAQNEKKIIYLDRNCAPHADDAHSCTIITLNLPLHCPNAIIVVVTNHASPNAVVHWPHLMPTSSWHGRVDTHVPINKHQHNRIHINIYSNTHTRRPHSPGAIHTDIAFQLCCTNSINK